MKLKESEKNAKKEPKASQYAFTRSITNILEQKLAYTAINDHMITHVILKI